MKKFFKIVVSIILVVLTLNCLVGCGGTEHEESPTPEADTSIFVFSSGNIKGLTDYGKTLTEIEIPDKIDGKTVTTIGEDAFFDNQTVSKIVLPNTITDIGRGAFYKCTALKQINLPNSLENIGEEAFSYCESLTSITLPESVKRINDKTFVYCTKLETINLERVDYIGDSAFASCDKLKDVTFSENLTFIGGNAFIRCKSIKNVKIPDSVTEMGSSVFANSNNIETLILGNGMNYVPKGFFRDGFALKWVVMDANITTVEEHSFFYCIQIEAVYYLGAESDWNNITFKENSGGLSGAKRYYYSELEPAEKGVYWHYENGVPTVWE